MKPLLVGARDHYAACLFRLEETRGHILSEQEYSEFRGELLEELTQETRNPVFAVAATAIAVCSAVGGGISLASGSAHLATLLVLSLLTLAAGTVATAQLRKTVKAATAKQRLEMLESLREHRLVTDVEFSTICDRLKAA